MKKKKKRQREREREWKRENMRIKIAFALWAMSLLQAIICTISCLVEAFFILKLFEILFKTWPSIRYFYEKILSLFENWDIYDIFFLIHINLLIFREILRNKQGLK